MTDDLVTWLRARLDEDEQWACNSASPDYSDGEEGTPGHSARVLAEIDAKRRIIDLHDSDGAHTCAAVDDAWGQVDTYVRNCPTLRLMAVPYAKAGREGYREEWRP